MHYEKERLAEIDKEKMKPRLMLGDCLERMKEIESGSVDMILTDPPYKTISGGKSKHKNAPSGFINESGNEYFKHKYVPISDYMPELFRVLKSECHTYVFTNTINLEETLKQGRLAGFKLHNVLIWIKNNCTPNSWYMKNIEYVVFFRKGKAKKIKNMGNKTAHNFNNVRNKVHNTEKPIGLLSSYIENSSEIGEIILDPFMGSGTTGVACKNLNRKFIGIELDENYFKIAQDRISAS